MKTKKRVTARPGKKVARKTRAVARKRPARPAAKPSARPAAKAKVKVKAGSQAKATAPVRPASVAPVKMAKPRLKPSSPRVQRLRAMLESKQAEILKQIKRARADSLDVDHAGFPEVGDLVSASVEKEKAFEYSEAGVNALREIVGALEKLKGGTYGVCERCGKPIGVKRLEAMPSARLCVNCKMSEEATSKIPPPNADNVFED